jgi:hypothetical protein
MHRICISRPPNPAHNMLCQMSTDTQLMGFSMAFFADDRDADGRDNETAAPKPRSLAPPKPEPLLDRDVVTLCARHRHLMEFAFRLADHGHTHVGDVIALSRFTLLDLADGEAGPVDALEHLLSHLGLALDTPRGDWHPPAPDPIDGQID